MNVYNKPAEALSPTGGEWRVFKASDVGINNSFSGAGGNPTTTPERTFPSEGEVRIYVVYDRVTHIEIPELGWTFRSESMHGTPIRGGINTTADWFTFGINSFKLMDPNGLVHKNSPNLRDKDFMQGVKTLTPCKPKPPNCFVAGMNDILTPNGYVPIEELKVGDMVVTLDKGPIGILALPSSSYAREQLNADDKLWPHWFTDEMERQVCVSRQHRIMREGSLISAAHLAKGSGEFCYPFQPTQPITYINIVLPSHEIIIANGVLVESAYLGGVQFRNMPLDHDALQHVADHHRATPARPFVNHKGERI